jgi:hypothetical protein
LGREAGGDDVERAEVLSPAHRVSTGRPERGGFVETLSTLDAEFLHIEDGIAHMHIAGACVFAGPPRTWTSWRGSWRGNCTRSLGTASG